MEQSSHQNEFLNSPPKLWRFASRNVRAQHEQAKWEKIFPAGREGIKQDTIDIAIAIHDSDEDTPKVRSMLARQHFAGDDDSTNGRQAAFKDIKAPNPPDELFYRESTTSITASAYRVDASLVTVLIPLDEGVVPFVSLTHSRDSRWHI